MIFGQAVSGEKIFEMVDGRQRTPDHWYTVSAHLVSLTAQLS